MTAKDLYIIRAIVGGKVKRTKYADNFDYLYKMGLQWLKDAAQGESAEVMDKIRENLKNEMKAEHGGLTVELEKTFMYCESK